MRLARRTIIFITLFLALAICLGATYPGLVLIKSHNGVSLVPDHCTKTSTLFKAGSAVFLPAPVQAMAIFIPVLWVSLPEERLSIESLPDETFRPPSL